ncbi:hypothetical protein WMY93_026029 [Mugilogobius chulae]|uniref:L1 transposable element RRM domain-containing protein n=1 Tax=Mugilogobius chulae TaxID=88201 RepID=A0AAW0N6D7_9GOBI
MDQTVTNKTLIDTLQQFKNEMLSHFDSKLDKIHDSVQLMQESFKSLKAEVGELEDRVSSNQDELSSLEARVKTLEKQNSYLADRVEDAENRSRASNIRLIRVPEGSEGRDMIGFVGQFLNQLFGHDKFTSPPVIERAHRSPGTPNPNPKMELMYKGTRVHIYPDFSAGLMEKRRLFNPIKKQLRDKNIEYALLYPATLRVHVDGKRFLFRAPEEAEAFIRDVAKKTP